MATSTTTPNVKEFNTSAEDAVAFTRENGDLMNLAFQHFGSHHELDLAVFDMADPEQLVIRDLVTLSLAEARILRTLLLKPEVSAILGVAE